MKEKRAGAYLLFTLLAVFLLTFSPTYSQQTTPESLFLTVYSDGFVFVDYTVLLDPTFPTQNVSIFGQVLENLLVVDEEGLPLDYSFNDSGIVVDSLGTNKAQISYLTADLTSKQGRYWTLSLDAPTNGVIILPTQATIISLSQVPELIETANNQVKLYMNADLIEVTYVIGIVGTKEHAQIMLDEAETTINSIKNQNILITQAEAKLQDAQTAFASGNYVEAETYANEAKTLATQTNQTAAQAQSVIGQAQNAVDTAENEHRTVGLNSAQELLDQANTEYENGNYSESLDLATQALAEAQDSETLLDAGSDSFSFYLVVGAILSLIVVVGFLFVRSRKKPKVPIVEKKKRRIDSERIFREHKTLLSEEKQAIQFLIDNNGEAFEAELYDYVKLPRTTTWRMVKRLQEMGIIKTSKFRRQNLVRIKTKYDIKE